MGSLLYFSSCKVSALIWGDICGIPCRWIKYSVLTGIGSDSMGRKGKHIYGIRVNACEKEPLDLSRWDQYIQWPVGVLGIVPCWSLIRGLCCWHPGYLIAAVNKSALVSGMHGLHLCHFGQLIHIPLWKHSGSQWQKLAHVYWLNNFVWLVLTDTKYIYTSCPLPYVHSHDWMSTSLILIFQSFPFHIPDHCPPLQCYLWNHIHPQLIFLLFPTEKANDQVQCPKLFPLEGLSLTAII